MQSPITAAAAAGHEALHLRLATLLRQVESLAARRATTPIPDPMRTLAEDLLWAARPFTGIKPAGAKPAGFPAAAPTYSALAAQLGQLLALLDAFELRHTRWDDTLKCTVWTTADGPLPVQRLHPKPAAPPPAPRDQSDIRQKLIERIERSREGAYDHGFRAGYRMAAGTEWPRGAEIPTPTTSSWSAGVETIHPGRKM